MKTAFQTATILFVLAALLAPLFALAKEEKEKPEKPDLRYERDGNRIVEKIKDNKASRGTNVVYRTGRTFPLMFSRPDTTAAKKGSVKK